MPSYIIKKNLAVIILAGVLSVTLTKRVQVTNFALLLSLRVALADKQILPCLPVYYHELYALSNNCAISF
jgi:hypothetical protein